MNGKALVALAMATAFGVLGTATIAKDDMGGGGDRGEPSGSVVPCSLKGPIPRFSAALPSQRPMVSSNRGMAPGTFDPVAHADEQGHAMPTARYRGPPMTLANMREQGVRSLWVVRDLYHHGAVMNVDRFSDEVPVPAAALRPGHVDQAPERER